MKSEFKTMGVLAVTNCGGYEIEISDCGSCARVRFNIGFGTTRHRWQEIKYNAAGDAYVKHNGRTLKLSDFMRIN